MEEEKRFDAEVYQTGSSIAWNILAHGFGGSAKTWKKQIDFFSKYITCLFWKCTGEKITKICTWIKSVSL